MTDLTIYRDLEQGTPEWLQARCGVITASTIGQLLTPTLKVADNEKSRGTILELAAQRISQFVEDSYQSPDMMRGHIDEPKARDEYADRNDVTVDEVGFITRNFNGCTIGYSPDGLVGEHGLIEVKSRRQKTQLSTWLTNEVPAGNMAQLQCGLLVTGREWIDYLSFAGGWVMFEKRVFPDPKWQAALLEAATFVNERIEAVVAQYQQLTAGLVPSERDLSIYDLEF